MTTLHVAMVQFELRKEPTFEQHISTMERLVREAVEGGAELIVFPEFSSTGLLGTITDRPVIGRKVGEEYRNYLAPMFPMIVERVSELAQQFKVTILGGSHNRIASDNTLRNTAILAHPNGKVEFQDKMHLTPPEHEMGALGGTELLITKVGDFTAGVLICADIQYPELSRYLVDHGVELIICPSLTWNRRGVHRVKTGCMARAMENQVYVVMSPLVGSNGLPEDAPMYAVGKSVATTPVDKTFGLNDGLLALSDSEGEHILYATLDRELLLQSREKPETPGLKLQRPELYKELRKVSQQ